METGARVQIDIANNATWLDAFTFGTPGDTTWDFVGQQFRMDVKANKDDPVALLTLQTADGTIVVDSTSLRVLHFNMSDTVFAPALPPGEYFYDLVMFNTDVPPIRVRLMYGKVHVHEGQTGN